MNASLDLLLKHPGIWRGNQVAQAEGDTIPTGFAELDEQLPGGGWPRGALTEILIGREGIGELQLLLPALASAASGDDWLVWVSPPHVPYAPALEAAGVDLARMLVASPRSVGDAWWTTEQTLRSGACSSVLAWLQMHDERRMRRLQLGAETGSAWGVLFRSAKAGQERSPAALRLLLESTPGGLAVHIIKRRGGQLGRPVLIDLTPPRTQRRRQSLALVKPALRAVPA